MGGDIRRVTVGLAIGSKTTYPVYARRSGKSIERLGRRYVTLEYYCIMTIDSLDNGLKIVVLTNVSCRPLCNPNGYIVSCYIVATVILSYIILYYIIL